MVLFIRLDISVVLFCLTCWFLWLDLDSFCGSVNVKCFVFIVFVIVFIDYCCLFAF